MTDMDMKGRILDFVSRYTDAHGYAPTYREIGDAVGLSAKSSVHRYVQQLREEGMVEMPAKSRRGMGLHRRAPVARDMPQRLRIELADGGFLFLDCAIRRVGGSEYNVEMCGIVDASHLRGSIGSVVACSVDNG